MSKLKKAIRGRRKIDNWGSHIYTFMALSTSVEMNIQICASYLSTSCHLNLLSYFKVKPHVKT